MKAIFVDKKTEELENYMLETEVIDNLNTKVDKQPPKGLSTNDFTDTYKANVEANNLKVSFPEAPIDGKEYVRKDGDWVVSSIAGQDGASAYEIALANGFIGTEAEWLESLVGPQGLTGEKPAHQWDGTSLRFENPDGSWGLSVNLIGPEGPQGIQGEPGADGADGLSAYEIAVNNGFIGDESAWLASLIGPQGPQGIQGIQGETGPQGPQGIQGPPGKDGQDGTAGPGVSSGGLAGQILSKIDDTDYNTQWIDPPTSAEWGNIGGSIASQTDLITLLDDKSDNDHSHDATDITYINHPVYDDVAEALIGIESTANLAASGLTTKADLNHDHDYVSPGEIFNLVYPIGSIYMSVNSTNPGTLFGGTWERFGQGRVLVGVNENDSDFNTVEKTGGAKTHNHSVPSHTHGAGSLYTKMYITGGKMYFKRTSASYSTDIFTSAISGYFDNSNMSYGTEVGGSTASGGGGSTGTSSNVQPYITCYMWKRIA